MTDRTKKHAPIKLLVIVTFSQMTVCSNSVVRKHFIFQLMHTNYKILRLLK